MPHRGGAAVKIVIVGMGVAGGVIAAGLRGLAGVDLVCLERVDRADHALAGNGLNIGPNAVAALRATLPGIARALEETALPWQAWRAAAIDGRPLLYLPLADVAPNEGLRIRWSDLYGVCRRAAGPEVAFRMEAVDVEPRDGEGFRVHACDGDAQPITMDADLVIVADGRFSSLRKQLVGAPVVRHLGVANFRVLLDDDGRLPIDDLEQWYTGSNRLLAFRLRDGLIYLSGNLPLAPGSEVPEVMKTAGYLEAAYLPGGVRSAPVPAWLVRAACDAVEQHHWSRAQEITACYRAAGGRVLFVGDAAHAMAPTLGQGATLALEDACAWVNLFRQAVTEADGQAGDVDLPKLTSAFAALRHERVDFIRQLSWDAADCLLQGADAEALVREKSSPHWRAQFSRLYREAPLPLVAA